MVRHSLAHPPVAELTAVDKQPVAQQDGSTQQKFTTKYGAIWVRVVRTNTEVVWYREHE